MRPVCLCAPVVRSGAPAKLAACVVLTLAMAAISGCGGSSSTTPPPVGNTKVSVVASSAANDKLSQFYIGLTGLTLTSQSGKTVTLFSGSANGANTYNPEFIHLNSSATSLTTVSVADDTYTSATLTAGSASFT